MAKKLPPFLMKAAKKAAPVATAKAVAKPAKAGLMREGKPKSKY